MNETQHERYSRLKRYFDDLFERRHLATRIVFNPVVFRDGSKPEPNQCHPNAERWVSEQAACSVVRGWLVHGNPTDHWQFYAHSVVKLPDEENIDITPLRYELPFLHHLGTEGAFAELLDLNLNEVIWKPVPAETLSGSWSASGDSTSSAF
jgi:hypothetical protein